MKLHSTLAALALVLASGTAQAAPAAPAVPDLSQDAIEAATLVDWEARTKAAAEALKAATEALPDTGDEAASAKSADPATPDAEAPANEAEDAAAADAPEAETSQAETSQSGVSQSETSEAAEADAPKAPDPFLIRLQILLDRAHVSPGVIDGFDGGNTEKAVRAYEDMRGLPVDGKPDADLWAVLATDGGKATMRYTITQGDIDGRYVETIPSDYGEMAKLKWLGYRGPAEMLAERFHMDEDLLRRLNPDAGFRSAGETILVADTGPEPDTKVARIVVDKSRGELFAYDEAGKIVLSDPATIGSADTPSPSGTVKVNGSAPDPTYAYNPDKNFKQGRNNEKLTIPAGPNGPVGSMWIDLSKPTYGIHGTPEPSKIDKTVSHGCVRLTNWDATALSKLVQPNKTVVEFKG